MIIHLSEKCEGKLEEFKEYYLGLNSCCLKEDAEKLVRRSVRLMAFKRSENDGPRGVAITELDDGTFAIFQEWQDYTGHG